MGEVFVIAAVSALDAGLLTAAVVMLGRPRPARQLLAYLIGGMGFSIVIGLLIVLSLHGSSVLHGLDRSTQAVIGVAVGGLLIFIATLWGPAAGRNGTPAELANATPIIRRGKRFPNVRSTMTLCGSRGLPVPCTARPARNT